MSSLPLFRADLHCHTIYSDGSLTPAELIARAKSAGLTGLSITDHDTVAAYAEAIPLAKKEGILLGTGVEFSSYDGPISIHVLGYDIRLNDPPLLKLCEEHCKRRLDRNRKILQKLKAVGMPLDESILQEGKYVVGRAHIAAKLLEKGYVKSYADAFNRLIGDGKPCFDPGNPISTDETLAVIHGAGGKAFIAHPHLLSGRTQVRKLLEKPFDGIECYYARCHADQERRWIKLAKERGLLMSGGSDFHGAARPDVPLGCSWVDEETFYKIFKNRPLA